MNSVKAHYDQFLGGIYSWMCGDFSVKVQENFDYFSKQQIVPRLQKRAIDLGCGPGYQSLALARLGFEVFSLDMNATLLAELNNAKNGFSIHAIEDDLLQFPEYCSQFEVAVCMGDTLTHLPSKNDVIELFCKVYQCLLKDGCFIITFRDLSKELHGLDRIIPVRNDELRIMTTFLEFNEDHVLVHDTLYSRTVSGWEFSKSCYPKLRLSTEWVVSNLDSFGFKLREIESVRGLVKIMVMKD